MKHLRHRRLSVSLAFLLVAAGSVRAAEPTITQKITLSAGWNLVSIQVGDGPMPVSAFMAALSSPSNLIEVWGYTPTGDATVPGAWQSYQPLVPAFPSDLTVLEPGRGYWVNVAQATTLLLENQVPWNGGVSLLKGWNLVGFPGVAFDSNEVQDLGAVFGVAFDRIQQVWTLDTGTQTFKGYDLTAIPALKALTSVQPGVGYWVYSISDSVINLTPQPYLALPGDGDASPPQTPESFSSVDARYLGSSPSTYVGRQVRYRNNAAPTDSKSDIPYDLNANGIIDEPTTQDTILYETASEAIPLSIGNSGSGTLTWSLENAAPWIYTAPADPRTWPAGVSSRPRLANGTVSSEQDTLILYADRTGMTPGRKSGDTVTLWIGGVPKVIHLLIDVPEVDGDWKGFATTTRVGGKNITLGEVRLALNAFRPPSATNGAFRAVLNREQAILFPRDVYMDGVFFSGNRFKLTTNFEMPPGDRNAPPFNTFPAPRNPDEPSPSTGDPRLDARGDRDYNGDGKVDAMNPFPFGIRREITLIGTRTTPNRLEGSYVEAIRGMLPALASNPLPSDINQFLGNAFLTTSQPVFIEGTFVLERQSFTPSQRSVVNTSVAPGVTFGGSTSGSRTELLTVNTTANINGQITVGLGIDIGLVNPTSLRVTLIAPGGEHSYILHDHTDLLAPSYTLPPGTFYGAAVNGEWQLVIDWDNTEGERATLTSWGLKIEAASTHRATGKLVRQDTSAPIPNVTINLEGGVATVSATTDAEGDFTFPELTENDYTLIINAPGYESTTFTFFISEQDVTLGQAGKIYLTPLTVNAPEIRAAPTLGYEPLNVEFQMLVPVDYGAAQIDWDFGDGSPPESGSFAGLVAPSHEYLTAGDFTPTATLSGGKLTSPVTLTLATGVHVQRRIASTAADAPSRQIIAGIQMGSVAARMDVGGNVPAANAFAYLSGEPTTTFEPSPGETPVPMKSVIDYSTGKPLASYAVAATGPSAASATLYQESQWDSATFDLDRYPFGTSGWAISSTLEDSDYGRSGSIMTTTDGSAKGQVFIFYNTDPAYATDDSKTATDEKWDARGYGQMTGANPSQKLPAFSLNVPLSLFQSDGSFVAYPPPDRAAFPSYSFSPDRPDRLRMAVTLGGAILSTETSPPPVGDYFMFPGRTLR